MDNKNQNKEKNGRPWEYQLTVDLILDGIKPIKRAYKELPLCRMNANNCLGPRQSESFVSEKLSELSDWITYTKDIFNNDINESWGPEGVEGNKADIEAACEKLINSLNALYDWEVSIISVIPDSSWRVVFDKLHLSTQYYIEETETFFLELKEIILNPKIKGRKELTFTFEYPPKMEGLQKDFEKAKKASLPNDSEGSDFVYEVIKKLMGL